MSLPSIAPKKTTEDSSTILWVPVGLGPADVINSKMKFIQVDPTSPDFKEMFPNKQNKFLLPVVCPPLPNIVEADTCTTSKSHDKPVLQKILQKEPLNKNSAIHVAKETMVSDEKGSECGSEHKVPPVNLSIGIFNQDNYNRRVFPCVPEENKELVNFFNNNNCSLNHNQIKVEADATTQEGKVVPQKSRKKRSLSPVPVVNGDIYNNITTSMSLSSSSSSSSSSLSSSSSTTSSSIPTKRKSKAEKEKETQQLNVVCEICNKKMRSAGSLSSHMKIHTGEKFYACETCGKHFSCSSNLNQHMLTHSKMRPFKCGQCNAAFNHKNTLVMHMMKHSGVRPYKCFICGSGFFSQHNLTNHIRIHTGEQPFPCEFCDKRFSQNCSLQRHLMIHRNERPFVCDLCGSDFNQKIHLKKHFIVHHSGKTPRGSKINSKKLVSPQVQNDSEINSESSEVVDQVQVKVELLE